MDRRFASRIRRGLAVILPHLALAAAMLPGGLNSLSLQARPLAKVTARWPLDPPLPPPRPQAASPPSLPQNPPLPPAPPTGAAAAPPPAASGPQPPTCLSALLAAGVDVQATTPGPQPDPRCLVAEPVLLSGLKLADGSSVAFPDKPTVACTTATTFSAFVRDLVVPLARGTYGSPAAAVYTGPGLDCRTRDHIPGAALSAHGLGLAVDIAEIRLGDGRAIEVGHPKADLDRGFEAAALAAGCGYFHTALGPGSDAFHETHWHFDLMPRGSKGDAKFCQGAVLR